MSSPVIRPELPNTKRRMIDTGQVWTVDGEPGNRWLAISPRRLIALFAGASDHTPETLVFTYGDRLRLEQIATVYAESERQGLHPYVIGGGRDADYLEMCGTCGQTPLAGVHYGLGTGQVMAR